MAVRHTLDRIRYARANSRLARKLLGLYYRDGHAYRIPFGPLRGLSLEYDCDFTFHAVLGLWEVEGFQVLSRVWPRPDEKGRPLVACDLGANRGLYTLWFSRQVGAAGRVYAFEPGPVAIGKLRANLALNDINNVTAVNMACTDRVGTVEFYISVDHYASSLDASLAGQGQAPAATVLVEGTSLDGFFYGPEPRPSPDVIKMDIEGGGVLALKGCDRCVRERQPLFLIESHTPAEDQAIGELLIRHDYHAYRLTNRRWVRDRTATHPNVEGVWGTLLACPAGERERIAGLLDTRKSGGH